MTTSKHDLIVIGGGPAGSTAALRAARDGLSTLLIEQDRHPRFHIGESLLPRNLELLHSLGLDKYLDHVSHTDKLGASFAFGDDDEPTDFSFRDGLAGIAPESINVERASFDHALFQAAQDAGATISQNTRVITIGNLSDGGCALSARDASGATTEHTARFVIDASGQSTVIGRHLKTRRPLPQLSNVAYFNHYVGVQRRLGEPGGYPLIVMVDEGWFWLIPIDDERMSIGLAIDAAAARRTNLNSKQILAWAIQRTPLVRRLTSRAKPVGEFQAIADFSYRCSPFAGPGYFLAGDAATFIDPIFSTGVCVAMMSGDHAAKSVAAILNGRTATRARSAYSRFVSGGTSTFFRMVHGYYRHSFRELLLNRTGPLQVHRAVISALAGHVFPKPAFALRWRLQLFHLCVSLQQRMPLVPRRAGFSLLDADPVGTIDTAQRPVA